MVMINGQRRLCVPMISSAGLTCARCGQLIAPPTNMTYITKTYPVESGEGGDGEA